MKPNSHVFLIFLLFVSLLFSYSTTARLLESKQGEQEMKATGMTDAGPLIDMKEEDITNLMGLEKCEDTDEECLNRRMVAEAHLDYIYTQHHKP
ncbi:hypothetical protein L1049_008210 [Liquidambar formosana]|uniref:Phytosulfokine n=1 Tax=Liquidambar formosana TaxID=63359 RepID=A0AAP0X5C3_LIQFO